MNMTTAQESAEQKSFTAANRASHMGIKPHISQRMALMPNSLNKIVAEAHEIDET